MKMVVAYIRHEAFDAIRTELVDRGFPSLTISEVRGSGRQQGSVDGTGRTEHLRPKVRFECVVADRDVETIVETVLKHARTGRVGDGKLFVLAVEQAYRIRTGQIGEDTLQAESSAGRAR
jgi:nitrogen regulatory protein PII